MLYKIRKLLISTGSVLALGLVPTAGVHAASLQGSTLDFQQGASMIFDNGDLHIQTDSALWVNAPVITHVSNAMSVGGALQLYNTGSGKFTGSQLFDNGQLHLQAASTAYIDAPSIAKVSNAMSVGGAFQLNNTGSGAFEGSQIYNDGQLHIQGSTGGTVFIDNAAKITGTLTGLTGLTVASGGATVTAGGLTVTAGGITVNGGNLTLSGGATPEHIISTQTTAPTAAVSVTGLSAATVAGTDTKGTITTTGTPSAVGTITTTFNTAYGSAPVVVITPANASGQAANAYVSSSTTGTFVITTTVATPGATPSWNYVAIQ